MTEEETSIISSKKVSSSVAGYIWDSPCLKPFVYNPFLLCAIIVLLIYAIDIIYGKVFMKGGVSMVIQHMLLTYILVAVGVVMNNMLIKHRYRLDKKNDKDKEGADTSAIDSNITSPYVET